MSCRRKLIGVIVIKLRRNDSIRVYLMLYAILKDILVTGKYDLGKKRMVIYGNMRT